MNIPQAGCARTNDPQLQQALSERAERIFLRDLQEEAVPRHGVADPDAWRDEKTPGACMGHTFWIWSGTVWAN